VCTQPDDVAEVQPRENYQLFVRYFDGTGGFVEMRELIFSDRAGVFASLRDPEIFAQVGIEYGAVTWANGVDIAPDATYEDFRRYGVQVMN
jgi:Protein of unknown function (DUF2442)